MPCSARFVLIVVDSKLHLEGFGGQVNLSFAIQLTNVLLPDPVVPISRI